MNATATQTRISLKNILFATDFSPAAEAALPFVLGLANQYGATVHGVHVRYPATYPIVGPEAMPQIIEAAEEQVKLEEQQMHEMLATVPHDVFVTEGDLWPTIECMLQKQPMDMIVMGTHGRTGFERAVLGSIAEEIFRKASCPVLTVGPHISKDIDRRLGMKQILYATDFSAESLAALPYAVSLAQEHQARLTILNVVEAPKTGDLVHPETYNESTMRQLRKLVPAEADRWCEPQFKIERGPAAEKIMETAIAIGADLIVLGVRAAEGHIGAATHILRSTAHSVVARAECPVLTVRG
jgi:nucleotide-binding universal stress UspA family protein